MKAIQSTTEVRINTLEELANKINKEGEWDIENEELIARNGWVSDCDTQYGVCHNEDGKVEFNEQGKAEVIYY